MSRRFDDGVREMAEEELMAGALSAERPLRKPWVIEELARRALTEPRLLPPAIEAITRERAFRPREPMAMGWLGGALILGSDDEKAISALVAAMASWNAYEQRDMVWAHADQENFAAATRKLATSYSFVPKYSVEGEKT